MRKTLNLLYLGLVLFALAACQTVPAVPATPASSASASAPASAPSIDGQIGTAMAEVTIARQAFTALAQAGKITWETDLSAQSALTAIRAQLSIAQTLVPTNPAQAATLLANALNALAAYQQGVPK